jgi:hypothetical protein
LIESQKLTTKDINEFISERINQILVWTLKSLKLSKHDIKSICDILTIEDISNQLQVVEEYACLPVYVKIDTQQENENCKDLLMIAQNFCSKINVALYVCRGTSNLLCLSLKFSRTELLKDPLAILAKF